jgi:hypothetical protein
VVVVSPREAPTVYQYTPRPPGRITPHREWGLNLHLAGIALGSGRSGDAGMGLIGLGLRFRPVPAFALEANIDVAAAPTTTATAASRPWARRTASSS